VQREREFEGESVRGRWGERGRERDVESESVCEGESV